MLLANSVHNPYSTFVIKNNHHQFVSFTENFITIAGKKYENEILGKTDFDDFPWSIYAEDYLKHEQDAISGNEYSALVPFRSFGTDACLILCNRYQRKNNKNEIIGTICHAVQVINVNILQLINDLKKIDHLPKNKIYYINKKNASIHLTPKEQECLFYIMRGKSVKWIARLMNVSHRTIEYHMNNLKDKFNCRSKSELICSAYDKGYLATIPNVGCANYHSLL